MRADSRCSPRTDAPFYRYAAAIFQVALIVPVIYLLRSFRHFFTGSAGRRARLRRMGAPSRWRQVDRSRRLLSGAAVSPFRQRGLGL